MNRACVRGDDRGRGVIRPGIGRRGDRPAGRGPAAAGGVSVYPFVYWAGVATTLIWVAFSAYTALGGF